MNDLQKVKKGLECCKHCTNENPFQMCDECPYNKTVSVQECRAVLSDDALKAIERHEIMYRLLENDWKRLREEWHTTGHWTTERTLEHDGEWYCDKCGYEPLVFLATPYCPMCGAKMEEKHD